jgi:hypothetical protein
MKHLKLILLLIFLSFTALIGCKNENKQVPEPKTSDSELTNIIIKQVDSLYEAYERFDYDWMEFYDDKYTAIYPGSPVQYMSKDSLKADWKRIYARYDVKLLSRGRPTVIPSEDMAISYNSFNEVFIHKETRDTIQNKGTYIVNWKRQPDDTWKIVFETVQNH